VELLEKKVHDDQKKMHPVKQDQEVICLCENLEVVYQWQTGVIILEIVNKNGRSLDGYE
jgi:hypothetical protein